MNWLKSLLSATRPHRSFARLDNNGRCRAFRQCAQPPVGDGWVEISEIRLNWLHQVLPPDARVSSPATHSRVQPLLGI
ncbi:MULTISPECIES: hypothetical protein [unclassified Pseudomonas]|uniref:hypothetical protein n=1 Tax=unclassified Pseudomonas TaxID=196821 RepID=UPI001475C0B7|nr:MULTISPECIES: hypothetical protein [unclassified Pseudomonas]NMY36807.1 hypothetical protein [Pseudomonas sp. WS 5078]NMY59251.1 hypothetical protein [Pseudomonas sp. WS 5354]